MSAASPDEFDGSRFRQVLGHYPTGVTVVTACGEDGEPVGMAVGSFTSVSLDPPLVAFFPEKSSSTFPRIREAGSFCVNVLSAHQEGACRSFAMRGHDRFKGMIWRRAGSGSPILQGVVAWIDCEIESVRDAGDHYLVLGRVRALDIESTSLPLLFFRGGYGVFSSRSLVVADEPDLVRLVRFSSVARPELEALASDLQTECTISAAVDANLVVLASAGSSSSESGPPMVGRRIPMLPPLGSQFMAWESEAAVRDWLARSPVALSDEGHALYEAALALVRERGWLVYRSDNGFADVDRFARRSFGGGVGSEASDEFEKVVSRLDTGFDILDLECPEDPPVSRVIAPVFGPDGRACLALNVHLSGEACPSDRLAQVRDRVVAAAARVTEALGGRVGTRVAAPAALVDG
jgi:flavin reductase (DIM6/NTAB) family NADH-FMN oxidoreductase RutF/DNA-binding IclR family transcriptional regulator